MIRPLIIFILIFNTCIINSLLAWDTTVAKYLPLKVGNVWVYRGYSATLPCHGSDWYDKYVLTGTTQINGKTYYIINHTLIFIEGNCSWSSILFDGDLPIRIDSATMNVYKRDNWCSVGESLVDSLRAKFIDTSFECSSPLGREVVCADTASFFFCGINRLAKSYRIGSGWEYSEVQRYAMGIGLVSYFYYCAGTYQISLLGCVINGQVCGDTSTPVGIRIISSAVPNEYYLSQNYPNPFNPSTKISFGIPNVETTRRVVSTRLVIYDILGREAVTLVDEKLLPGTYEVMWDASNYPSGVYFYKIFSGEFSESKKMILVK